jgi:hypothetical protein
MHSVPHSNRPQQPAGISQTNRTAYWAEEIARRLAALQALMTEK